MEKNRTTNSKPLMKLDWTLRDAVAPIFRHRKVGVVVFAGVFAMSLLVAWGWVARYYTSTMQVLVEQDRSDPSITSAQNAAVPSSRSVTVDQVTSEIALLQGKDMLREVANTCHLADDPAWTDMFLPADQTLRRAIKLEKATEGMAKKLKVDAATMSHVIDVKFGATGDPEVPACVLQNLSKLYLQKHLQLNRPQGSSDFFAEETEKYRKAMEKSETELVSFSQEQGVAAPEVQRAFMAQQAATFEVNLYQVHQAIEADQQRLRSIDEQMAKTPARVTTSETTNAASTLLQQLEANLLAAKVKRTDLLTRYAPEYPLVKEADKEIAETEQAIERAKSAKYVNATTDRDQTYEFLRQDRAKVVADLASQQATAASLNNSIKNIRLDVVRLDSQAVKQAALVREAKANEANYLLYLGKREQERTSDALDQRNIANVAIAVPPTVPLLPAHSPVLITFLGFWFAIFSGLAAAYLAEYMDPSFRTPAEVHDTLNLPVLASMPRRAA